MVKSGKAVGPGHTWMRDERGGARGPRWEDPVAGTPTPSPRPPTPLYLTDQRLPGLVGDENPPTQTLVVGPVAPGRAGAADGGILGVREASGRRKCRSCGPRRWEQGRCSGWTVGREPRQDEAVRASTERGRARGCLRRSTGSLGRRGRPGGAGSPRSEGSPCAGGLCCHQRGGEDEGPAPAWRQASRRTDFPDGHPRWRPLGLSRPSLPPPPAAGLGTGQAIPAPEPHRCGDHPGRVCLPAGPLRPATFP